MENKKRIFLILIAIVLFSSIDLHGSAFFSENKNSNSLQWFPSLAVDNETVYVVWADERNGNYTRIMNNQPHKSGDIYLSRGRFQNGWVFDENIRINELKGTTGHGSPSVAVDSDNIYVVWEDDRYGFEELYFTSTQKNNIKFNRDSAVVEATGSQVLPSVEVLNGSIYVAMMNKKTWDIDFTEGHSIKGVYRFDKPVRVNDDSSGWHYAPSLAVDDEKNVCIAWLDARNNDYDIYFSHGTKENGTWHFGENVRVNEDTNASHYTPSLAFENGYAYIAWYDDRNKDFDVYFSIGRLENNSWKFGKNTVVNDNRKGDQMHPAIAVKDGEIFVAWEDGRDGNDIYFSKGARKNESLEFGKNIKVSDVDGKHYSPQIRIDSKNNIYIVWQAEETPYLNTGTDGGDIFFSHGKYNGKNLEFGRNIKVNDDVTNLFVKPNSVFLILIPGTVIVSIVLVSFLRRKK